MIPAHDGERRCGHVRLVRPGLGFGGLETAKRTLAGYEVMAMIRKGQVYGISDHDTPAQAAFVAGPLTVVAQNPCWWAIACRNPEFATELARTLKRIRDGRGLSIVASEQKLSFALDIADRVIVMEGGVDMPLAPDL